MAGVEPLGPTYPSVPARKVGDEERDRRRRAPARKKPVRKKRDDGESGSRIDEYV